MATSLASNPHVLQRGQPVFLVGYHDQSFKLPFVEAYVFQDVVGDPGSGKRWRFLRAEAATSGNDGSANGTGNLLLVDRQGLETLFDWSGLVEELSERLRAHGATK